MWSIDRSWKGGPLCVVSEGRVGGGGRKVSGLTFGYDGRVGVLLPVVCEGSVGGPSTVVSDRMVGGPLNVIVYSTIIIYKNYI